MRAQTNGLALRLASCVTEFVRSARLGLRSVLGKALNELGIPGFVRNSDYAASSAPVTVAVRVRPMFTVMTVNGLDIYFHRLTGAIDGVGFTPGADCKPAEARELEHSAAGPAPTPGTARS